MDYNEINRARELARRWQAGSTTLAEEAELREFFASADAADAADGLPADLRAVRAIFGRMEAEMGLVSGRPLKLHIDSGSRSLRKRKRWLTAAGAARAAAATAAAAVIAAVVVLTTPTSPTSPYDPATSTTSQIVCVVNGERITDPTLIAHHTRQALLVADANLRKPSQTISSRVNSDPTLAWMGELLNELSNNQ